MPPRRTIMGWSWRSILLANGAAALVLLLAAFVRWVRGF